ALVHHLHTRSSGEWSPFFTFHVDRNRLFMSLKNAPPRMVMESVGHFAGLSAKNASRTMLGRVMRPPQALRRADLGPGRARIHVDVMRSLAAHLPEMLSKRREIRSRRPVPDRDIERWFY